MRAEEKARLEGRREAQSEAQVKLERKQHEVDEMLRAEKESEHKVRVRV